jgi:hypothetical protein
MPRTARQPQPPSDSAPGRRTNTREDKRRRFLMHIERRMAEIKRQLDFLENMAGPNYEFTAGEAKQICATLDRWVGIVKTQFLNTERPVLPEFRLGGTEE